MLGALDHGHTHAFERTRSQNDNDAGALHELQRKTAHLRFAYRRILPSPHAARGYDWHVRIRSTMWYCLCRLAKTPAL